MLRNVSIIILALTVFACGDTQSDTEPEVSLVGTWEFVPSQEQNEFAAAMNKKAGPLKYTFNRNDTYMAVGGPLSGRNYVEEGVYEFDGHTLVLHRKSVGGTRALIYERTSQNAVRFENDGSTIVGDKNFGDWTFMGAEVRFSKR